MDFGIARAMADHGMTMTQTAAVIGTAQYLSPEQAKRRDGRRPLATCTRPAACCTSCSPAGRRSSATPRSRWRTSTCARRRCRRRTTTRRSRRRRRDRAQVAGEASRRALPVGRGDACRHRARAGRSPDPPRRRAVRRRQHADPEWTRAGGRGGCGRPDPGDARGRRADRLPAARDGTLLRGVRRGRTAGRPAAPAGRAAPRSRRRAARPGTSSWPWPGSRRSSRRSCWPSRC